MSKTLVSMLIAIMKNVLSSAYAEGIIARDPSVALAHPKTGERKERRALTGEETIGVERAIQNSEHGFLLAVLYYLGLRRGEALGLKWSDIDWQEEVVHIERDVDFTGNNKGADGALKTKAARRQVPIPPELMALLRVKRGLPAVYLFGTAANQPLSLVTFQRRWMQLMIVAGLAVPVEHGADDSKDKKRKSDLRQDWATEITPHYLRHNYITKLYDAGVDPLVAMRLVGHADYKTTAQIYTHLNNTHIQAAAEKIGKVFGCKKLPESCQTPKNRL